MRVLVLVLLPFLLISCAGPMSPFGAIETLSTTVANQESLNPARAIASAPSVVDLNKQIHPEVLVNFSPEVQLFHRSMDWSVQIKDHLGVPPQSLIQVFYRGEDITAQLKKVARWSTSDDQKTLTIQVNGLSFPAGRAHDVSLVYQRDPYTIHLSEGPETNIFFKQYHRPRCQLKKQDPLQNLGLFSQHEHILEMIEMIALKENTNPGLIAGLVAQESGFNPKAVSWAKAIGLTQVTSIAEAHILDDSKNWPTYPGIDQMNHAELKAMILAGKINKKNEWRLDKEKSLLGGIHYLHYLVDYWTKPMNWNIMEEKLSAEEINQEVLTQIILASYHSGAYRVKRAIADGGSNWLSSDQLKGARFYVQKVSSYCHEFSTEYL